MKIQSLTTAIAILTSIILITNACAPNNENTNVVNDITCTSMATKEKFNFADGKITSTQDNTWKIKTKDKTFKLTNFSCIAESNN